MALALGLAACQKDYRVTWLAVWCGGADGGLPNFAPPRND